MASVQGHILCALLGAAWLASSSVWSLGCRGEREERERSAEKARAPADEPVAWPPLDEPALAAWTQTGGYQSGVPRPLAIAPDGAVLFARSGPRDPRADLYQLDPAGKVTLLAAAQALLGAGAIADAERPRAAQGIAAVDVTADGGRLLIPLAGRLFVVERSTGAARELAVGAFRDPHLSPDGKLVAFVRDGDLWIAPIPPPGPAAAQPAAPVPAPATRLTQHPPDREYATPEVVARDFGRDRGYWWSPDGQWIAFQRTGARAVDTLYLGDPRHPELPPAAVRFPRAGKANATVDLGIVSVRGGAPRWVTWDVVHFPYLAQVVWPAKAALTVVAVGREQNQVAVVAIDAPTGPAAATARQLLVDKDPAWVNVVPDAVTWLGDGSAFLWVTESHGARSLEQRAPDGALVREVMTADVGLQRVVGLSPDGRDVIVEGTIEPREQHVWKVPLAGGAPVPVNPPDAGGVHRAWSAHGTLVIASQQRAGDRATTVIRPDGTRADLPSVAERPPAPTTRIETVQLDDHIQDVAITRPRSFDSTVRYPVVLLVLADPDVKAVRDALDLYALDQRYADAGFIVVRQDGRGTPGHDRTWQRMIWGDVLTLPINDQIGGLKRIGGRYPEANTARTGVLGGPGVFGSHLATLSVMTHSDVFTAAVAISPVTDWGLLDTALAERYMKSPLANPEGYRRVSALAYADQLARPLLLMYRPGDDGEAPVHGAHTLALIDALSAAGKHVEVATLPDGVDPALALGAHKLAIDFLRQRLGPPVRPAAMPKPRTEEEEEERERERERGHAGGDKDRGDKARGDKDRGDKDRGETDRH